MKFSQFAQFLDKVEHTSSRNAMTTIVAEFFPALDPLEVGPAMYLMQGRLVPLYQDVEFNFSEKLLVKGMEESASGNAANLFKELGDIGLVAEKLYSQNPDAGLTIIQVYEILNQIPPQTGAGSQERKTKIVLDLLGQLDAISCRYVTRVIVGSLRLGLSDKTVLDSLSWLVTGGKSLRTQIEKAFGARADIGWLATVIVEKGRQLNWQWELGVEELKAELAQTLITPGVPVASKLVEREGDAASVFARTGPGLVQPKLDGLRAQIHLTNEGEAFVFSRNMENMTAMFPDLVAAVKTLGVNSVIIDSEAIGYDADTDTFVNFQQTMTRKRKHDIEQATDNVPLKAMTFDLLHLNGEDYSDKPVQERVNKLREIIDNSGQKIFQLLETIQFNSETELHDYFITQVTEGLEGVIIKKLNTTYDPGTRNFDWIKLKANTRSELVDTVDVVVIGYFGGRGARAAHGIGALLTAVYDPETDNYLAVAKVGSGVKDEDWAKINADIANLKLETKPENVIGSAQIKPDVWLQPQIVIEVVADEITRSPAYPAAANITASFETETKGRGLSLRFPRLKIWNRDKKADQATTVKELLRLYEIRKTGLQ